MKRIKGFTAITAGLCAVALLFSSYRQSKTFKIKSKTATFRQTAPVFQMHPGSTPATTVAFDKGKFSEPEEPLQQIASRTPKDGEKTSSKNPAPPLLADGRYNLEFAFHNSYHMQGNSSMTLLKDANGTFVLNMQIKPMAEGRCRAEVKLQDGGKFGDERTYEFMAKWLGGAGTIISQWHQNASVPPPVSLSVKNDRFIFKVAPGQNANLFDLGPVDDQWNTFTLEARWSFKDNGLIRIYRNSKLIKEHHGPNQHNKVDWSSNWKMGTYAAPKDGNVLLANPWSKAGIN